MQIVLLIIIFLVVLFGLPLLLNKRAVIQVIKIFRTNNALDPETALSLETLRLNPPSFKDRLMRFRDYKPNAVRSLAQVGVLEITEEGKYYLVEEKLNDTKLARH